MLEKFTKDEIETVWEEPLAGNVQSIYGKINDLIDAVNALHEKAENNARIRAKHENLIDTLIVENNIHEEQIDELQMKLEPHKCEPAENGKSSKMEQDPFAKQQGWVGKLCRFWDEDDKNYFQFGILGNVGNVGNSYQIMRPTAIYFDSENSGWWEHCEPVKPDDDIIYKGE